ncbi:cytochrome c [Leptobacterium flavescens]|uniref:Cytochrome c n=1 Tax=Leptobacterium flavescens TaxID=472055 RepID=A0A6P0USV2_9FLAO|nr:cytochrome c [Leptobacterium flavescens]NER13446.1 cytochrome c [Leptobacterium flavescens]
MTKKQFFSLFLWLSVFLASCENFVENEEEPIDVQCENPVSYTTTIRPLINLNCMPCHNGDGTEPGAPDLTTFNAVNNLADLVREVTQSRRMPLGGSLTDKEINDIRCWVEQGAQNN